MVKSFEIWHTDQSEQPFFHHYEFSENIHFQTPPIDGWSYFHKNRLKPCWQNVMEFKLNNTIWRACQKNHLQMSLLIYTVGSLIFRSSFWFCGARPLQYYCSACSFYKEILYASFFCSPHCIKKSSRPENNKNHISLQYRDPVNINNIIILVLNSSLWKKMNEVPQQWANYTLKQDHFQLISFWPRAHGVEFLPTKGMKC